MGMENRQSRSMTRQALAARVRRVRIDHYGEEGGPELADLLGLPDRTWANYEDGVVIPAEVVLDLIDLTGVEPIWLLRGDGEMYRPTVGHGRLAR